MSILLCAIGISSTSDAIHDNHWIPYRFAPAGSHVLFTFINNRTHEYTVFKAINVFESASHYCLIGGIELTMVISKSDVDNLRLITIKNMD